MLHTHEESPSVMGRVLHDVFNRQHLLLDEIADRYFAPDYRQRTNGSWSRRAEVVDHLARVREVAERADIVVEEELSQGRVYADRHVVRVHKRGGGLTVQEVYVFAHRAADGRLRELHETTMMLEGSETDRSLGQA
ncbi:hypothetical protein [Kocuria massiliensis]|uniref:hypothetical protein n=1 Tax=Kocuria massiliensis TaxID=1926282 RepID=UPI0022B96ACE|nr:hypothetical protein [Kocuria massiliensis]